MSMRGGRDRAASTASEGGVRAGTDDDRDWQLMIRVAAQDRDAFKQLYQIYHRRLSRFLMRLTRQPEIAEVFQRLYRKHRASIELIRERATCRDRVVFFDLGDTDLAGYNKFIPYYLHPESVYTVAVVDAGFRTKISVGSNPWADVEPESFSFGDLGDWFGEVEWQRRRDPDEGWETVCCDRHGDYLMWKPPADVTDEDQLDKIKGWFSP